MNYALLTTVVLVLLCLLVALWLIIRAFYRWVRRVSIAANRRLKASREERRRRREAEREEQKKRREAEEERRARKAQERKDNRTDGDPSHDKNGCLPFSLVFLAGIVFAVVVIFGILSGLGFEIAIGIFSMPFG